MSDRAVVNLNGEFVLSTRYGANPIILGLDLYRGKKDVQGIVRTARFWEIDGLDQRYRGVVESLVPEARFTEEAGKDFFVRLVDFTALGVPDAEKAAALDRVSSGLNQQEKTFVMMKYLSGGDNETIAEVMGITEEYTEILHERVVRKVGKELKNIGVPVVQSPGCITYNLRTAGEVNLKIGNLSAHLQDVVIPDTLANPNQPELRLARRMELAKKYLDVLAEVARDFPEDDSVRKLVADMQKFQEADSSRLEAVRSVEADMQRMLQLLKGGNSSVEANKVIGDEYRALFDRLKVFAERDPATLSDIMASGDAQEINKKLREMALRSAHQDERVELAFMDMIRTQGLDEDFGNFLIGIGCEMRYVDVELLRRQFLK